MRIADLALLTIRAPREGMRAVLNLDLPIGIAVIGIALVAVLSALLLHLSILVSPSQSDSPMAWMTAAQPVRVALSQGVMLLVTALLAHGVGRLWGGAGRFVDSVVMVAWLQGFFVVLQAAQLVGLVILPPVAGLIGLLSIGLFFWLLSHFVAEVHGFVSPTKVFLGILVTLFALSFGVAIVIAAVLGPEVLSNV